MDRRHVRLAFLIAVFVLALLPNTGTPAVASPRVSGAIVASEHSDAWPTHRGGLTLPSGAHIDAADAGTTGGATLLYTSDTIDSGQLFDRVGVHWIAARGAENGLYFEVRTSADGTAWAGWRQLHPEEDMTDEVSNEFYAMPVPVDAARYAQYRVWITSGRPDDVERVNLTFMDVSDLNQGPLVRLFEDIRGAVSDFARSYTADAAPVGPAKIRTRQDWGADESLMQWVPRYQKVQKFVIHHTVTDDGGTDVTKTIRAIYYYHAVTRGWGDIGYNYLVDKNGVIWTGRQGGDNVIAGHAYGWNNGSIGIAAIGDYSVTVPTSALQTGIGQLLAIKATQFGISIFGSDTFTHQEQRSDGTWINVTSNPPNIQGHRQCNYIVGQSGGQTACPGNGLYNQIQTIKTYAANAVANGFSSMPYIEPALPRAGFPGATLSVPVVVTNKGRTPIPAGTFVSYQLLRNGVVAVAQGGRGTIPMQLAPGAAASVTVPFVVPAAGAYVARWDLQTGTAWWSGLYATPVRDQWFNSADWSADWLSDTVPHTWTAGATQTVSVTVQNDGGRVWNAAGTDPVQLGYKWVSDSTGNIFPGPNKTSLPYDVQPGQTVTLSIAVTAPVYPTNYTMTLDLYKQNEFTFAQKGVAPDDTPIAVTTDFRASYTIGALPAFTAGQNATVPVTITNKGLGVLAVTNSYPVDLGYHWYTSTGTAVVWEGARTKLPADLQPGQSVTLPAQVNVPTAGGAYQLRFDLVQEGVTWFSQKGLPTANVNVTVAGPTTPAYGATYQIGTSSLGLVGALATVPITVTNKSNFAWSSTVAQNPIDLGYHWVDTAGNVVVWDGIRTKLTSDLAPGASQLLQAALQYPSAPGSYVLKWDMVQEGVAWFSQKGVPTGDVGASVSQPTVTSGYGAGYDTSYVPSSVSTEMITTMRVTVGNTSQFAWSSSGTNPIDLSYHWYDASGKLVVWDGRRTALPPLAPGQNAVVTALVNGPPAAGTYILRFDVVQEGVTWFSGKGVIMPANQIAAAVPLYGALVTSAPVSVSGAPGSTTMVPLTIKNTGSLTWDPTQGYDVAYHITNPSGGVIVWDGVRTALPGAVAAGRSVTLNVSVKVPLTTGSYIIRFEMVREGYTWFSGQGVPTGDVALRSQ